MHNGPAHIAIIFIHSQSVGRLCRCPTHTFDYIVDDSMDFRFQQMFRRGDDYHNEIILLAWNGNNCTKSKCQMTISSFLFFFFSFFPPYQTILDVNRLTANEIMQLNGNKRHFRTKRKNYFEKNQFSSLWMNNKMKKQPSTRPHHMSYFTISVFCLPNAFSTHKQKSVISFWTVKQCCA